MLQMTTKDDFLLFTNKHKSLDTEIGTQYYDLNLNQNLKASNKNDSLNVTNSSILSLHISAYKNSNEASSDFLNKSWLIQKQKRINPILTFVSQNPFEFPRQQNDEIPAAEMSQFKASQQLLNSDKSDVHSDTESSNHTVWIVLIAIEVLLILAFNLVSIFIGLKLRGKFGGIKPTGSSLGKFGGISKPTNPPPPGSKEASATKSASTKSTAAAAKPQKRPPTLAEKQRIMKKTAPPSSFTSISQRSKSVPRKCAGREESLTYGSWSKNFGQSTVRPSEMESFTSPLDYLDAFCPAQYFPSDITTETLGDGGTEMSSQRNTDEFEEIEL
uniref:Uncharacterized protein n=1 Tax=Panagrolaimus sp. PS1159 TaxID=55785 RepID=A0AC35FJ73_9BILA